MNQKQQTYWQQEPDSQAPQGDGTTTPVSAYDGYELSAAKDPAEPENSAPAASSKPLITWEASEYVHHQKNPLWYLALVIIAAAAFAASIFLKAWTFAALVVVMAVAVAFFAIRPPRSLQYKLSSNGLQIDDRHYNFSEFRSFGIVQDGGLYSIMLIPVKRFMPALTVYFEHKDGEKIVDILGARLPMEQLKQDPIDKLMRNLRF